jgi:hypothetical protein
MRISNEPNFLLSKYLRAKSCKNESIFTIRAKASDSVGWRGILSCKNIALVEAKWCVGNGRAVQLRHPNFLSGSP